MASDSSAPRVIKSKPKERSQNAMIAKRAVQFCFVVIAVPRLASYHVARLLIGRRAFMSTSESAARIPGIRGVYLRQALYSLLLDKFGSDVFVGWCTVFSMTEARVGDRAYVGRYCNIGFAEIGEEVMLADGVQILSGGREHDSDDTGESMHEQGQTYQQVKVGCGAWVGAGAILMADVGQHATVGAGAVVTREIPAGAIAVGSPAKVIRYRDGWDAERPTSVKAKG